MTGFAHRQVGRVVSKSNDEIRLFRFFSLGFNRVDLYKMVKQRWDLSGEIRGGALLFVDQFRITCPFVCNRYHKMFLTLLVLIAALQSLAMTLKCHSMSFHDICLAK